MFVVGRVSVCVKKSRLWLRLWLRLSVASRSLVCGCRCPPGFRVLRSPMLVAEVAVLSIGYDSMLGYRLWKPQTLLGTRRRQAQAYIQHLHVPLGQGSRQNVDEFAGVNVR